MLPDVGYLTQAISYRTAYGNMLEERLSTPVDLYLVFPIRCFKYLSEDNLRG